MPSHTNPARRKCCTGCFGESSRVDSFVPRSNILRLIYLIALRSHSSARRCKTSRVRSRARAGRKPSYCFPRKVCSRPCWSKQFQASRRPWRNLHRVQWLDDKTELSPSQLRVHVALLPDCKLSVHRERRWSPLRLVCRTSQSNCVTLRASPVTERRLRPLRVELVLYFPPLSVLILTFSHFGRTKRPTQSHNGCPAGQSLPPTRLLHPVAGKSRAPDRTCALPIRSEEHTSELQSRLHL